MLDYFLDGSSLLDTKEGIGNKIRFIKSKGSQRIMKMNAMLHKLQRKSQSNGAISVPKRRTKFIR